jgi:hypothetical protein
MDAEVAVCRAATLQIDGDGEDAAFAPRGKSLQEFVQVSLGGERSIRVIEADGSKSEFARVVWVSPRAGLGIIGIAEDGLHGTYIQQRAFDALVGRRKPGGRSVGDFPV